MKNIEEFSGKGQENGPVGRRRRKKKRQGRKSNGSMQKNKRPDGKVKSNDSPEIPQEGLVSSLVGALSPVNHRGLHQG